MTHPSIHARNHPDKIAYQMAASGKAITYRELDELSNQGAHLFRSLGLKAGDHIALLMENRLAFMEICWAAQRSGLYYTAISRYLTEEEIAYIIKDCGAKVFITTPQCADKVKGLIKGEPGEPLFYMMDEPAAGFRSYDKEAAAQPTTPVADEVAGYDMLYSSGTTGRPKGVMLSHGNLMANALNALGEGLWPSSTIYLHAAPMFHLANGAAMYSVLLSGGSNVVIQGFTPDGVAAAVQKERVTDVLLVPTMIQMFVDHPTLANYDLSSLKRIAYGASVISDAVLMRAMKALPHVEFTQAYGMTELSPIATLLHWKEHIGDGRAKGRHRGAGRATLGAEVKIVDAEDKVVPTGTVGEIAVRGDMVMMGYRERPEETARAVIDGAAASTGRRAQT